MTSVTIKFSKEESRLIESYATQERRSVSDVIRLTILDRIEGEYDLAAFRQAKMEHEASPVTYTLDEAGRMLWSKMSSAIEDE
jgi:hypothetical protein